MKYLKLLSSSLVVTLTCLSIYGQSSIELDFTPLSIPISDFASDNNFVDLPEHGYAKNGYGSSITYRYKFKNFSIGANYSYSYYSYDNESFQVSQEELKGCTVEDIDTQWHLCLTKVFWQVRGDGSGITNWQFHNISGVIDYKYLGLKSVEFVIGAHPGASFVSTPTFIQENDLRIDSEHSVTWTVGLNHDIRLLLNEKFKIVLSQSYHFSKINTKFGRNEVIDVYYNISKQNFDLSAGLLYEFGK